jgi:hypothetical protein
MYLCIYLNMNIHNMIFVKININIYYYYYINNEETNSNAISTWQ